MKQQMLVACVEVCFK